MDEPDFAPSVDDETHVNVQTHDVKPFSPLFHRSDEIFDSDSAESFDVSLRGQTENDVLGSLLREPRTLDLPTRIAQHGGDEIAAGDLALPGRLRDPVEIPGRSVPEREQVVDDGLDDRPAGAFDYPGFLRLRVGLPIFRSQSGSSRVKPGDRRFVVSRRVGEWRGNRGQTKENANDGACQADLAGRESLSHQSICALNSCT